MAKAKAKKKVNKPIKIRAGVRTPTWGELRVAAKQALEALGNSRPDRMSQYSFATLCMLAHLTADGGDEDELFERKIFDVDTVHVV